MRVNIQVPGHDYNQALRNAAREAWTDFERVAGNPLDGITQVTYDAGIQEPRATAWCRAIYARPNAPNAVDTAVIKLLQHLLLGETPGCVLLEYPAHDGTAVRIG